MVSLRCKMFVREELDGLGLHYLMIELGMVEILEDITQQQRLRLSENLFRGGLELQTDSRSILIEQIKSVVIEMVHHSENLPLTNFSNYISKRLGYDYTHLSNIFSQANGITIQHFIITHKIEKVKELLLFGDLTLTDISYKLDYSSVGHLSAQFKKITGLSPSNYKTLRHHRSANLENL